MSRCACPFAAATYDTVCSESGFMQKGSEPAERAAVAAAGGAARGATAYLNLESGNCHGDLEASTGALIAAGVPTTPFLKGYPGAWHVPACAV